jgi:hypothetical protein
MSSPSVAFLETILQDVEISRQKNAAATGEFGALNIRRSI